VSIHQSAYRQLSYRLIRCVASSSKFHLIEAQLSQALTPLYIVIPPIIYTRTLIATLFALLFSSLTSFAGHGEFLEKLLQHTEKSFSFLSRKAAGITAAEAAKVAFASLPYHTGYGGYLARTEDAILYFTAVGEQRGKWGLKDGAGVARFASSEAMLNRHSVFELLVESDVFLDPAGFLQELPANVLVRYVSPDGHVLQTRLTPHPRQNRACRGMGKLKIAFYRPA
jgi:hypothetical protein